jgi:hypothetical protein
MGSSMSLEEQIKHDVRMMDRHERIIGRDLTRMEREKKDIGNKIKVYASRGDVDMVNTTATQFMVYKINIKKMSSLKTNTAKVKQNIKMMRSVTEINKALVTLTSSMKAMNEKVGASSLGNIIREYDRELAKSEVNVEMMDDVMTDDIDEDEQRDIVNSALADIGVEFNASIQTAPTADTEVEKILESRLKSLLI